MPTYEYQCASCEHQFEKRQDMSEKPLKTCPKCGQPVRRLIGAGVGLIFKGSGFYAIDHGRSDGSSCSLEQAGATCYGRSSRCDSPACESGH